MAINGKVRVGLIGCGGISGAHLPNLAKFEDVELTAFCDIVVERAEKRNAEFAKGAGKVFNNAEKMIAETELDAAYILIPTYAHGAPERACIAAKVPFLVEKPLHIDAEDLIKLDGEIKASGILAVAGFMNRYRKSVNRAREVLQADPAILLDGAWISGAPRRRDGDYFANNPIGQWWPIKEKSGGQFVEQVIHTTDLARYLGGEVVEVFAHAARGFNQKLSNLVQNYTNDDAMVVSLKFESGAVGNLMASCSTGAGGGVFLNVWSSKHAAKFTDWDHHLKLYTEGESTAEEIKGNGELAEGDTIFTLEDRAFMDAVKTGDRSGIKSLHTDAVRTTLVSLAANESAATGQAIKVRYS